MMLLRGYVEDMARGTMMSTSVKCRYVLQDYVHAVNNDTVVANMLKTLFVMLSLIHATCLPPRHTRYRHEYR